MTPIAVQPPDAEPTPTDAVRRISPFDTHRFDKVHLVAIRRLTRVLPDQPPAVGEEPDAVAAPRIQMNVRDCANITALHRHLLVNVAVGNA
jgi:hypothetical protein